MIIVVDGYNLLKHVFHRVKGRLDKQRKQLIKELGFYKKKKSKLSEIVLVFDGGRESRATREILSGITVIFSGQQESADDWIVEYVELHKEQVIILVTRDRELISRCKSENLESSAGEVTPLNVVDFYDIVQNELLKEIGTEMQVRSEGAVKKYEDGKSEALDILMEQASVEAYEKKDELPVAKKKKGRTRTPSKEEKKLIAKLDKL
jgi:hypothetical protein